MQKNIKIGESEWYVMKALWDNNPLSGAQIVERVAKETDLSQSTIHTMIRRLHKKGAVRGVKQEVMLYSPAIKREEAERMEAASFIKRVYEGSAQSMVTCFIKDSRLSDDDIKELRRLLDERERK